MKRNLSKILAIVFFVILPLSMLVLPSRAAVPAEPHNADSMWIEPSNVAFSLSNASIGQLFNVTVWLNITSDNVFGYQVALHYNRTQLEATRSDFTGTSKSDFMTGHATQTAGPEVDTSSLGNGSVLAFESCKGNDFVAAPHVGSLIWIEFQIILAPQTGETLTSTFDLTTETANNRNWVQDFDLFYVTLAVSNGFYTFTSGTPPPAGPTLTITASPGGTTNPAPGAYSYTLGQNASVQATANGNYVLDHWDLDWANVGATNPYNVTMDTNHTLNAAFIFVPPSGTRLYVDPAQIMNLTMGPSSVFTINITTAGVTDMSICQFNLTYDPNVLNLIGINIQKVQNEYPTPKISQDGFAGYLWIKLTYATPVTTADPTVLVILQFHVEAYGISPLNLTDTHLTDKNGNPLPHDDTDGLFANVIRDVAITNVVPYQNKIYQNWPLNVTVTAKNNGNVSETFDVKAYYNVSLIGTQTVTNLAPSATVDLIFTWDTTGVPEGNYTISANATTVPYEFNTFNNNFIDGIVSVVKIIRDLAITNVVTSRTWVYQGHQVQINVTAKNEGNLTETFNVSAYFDSSIIGNQTITNLPPDNETTLTFIWSTIGVPYCHNYTISAYAWPVPGEANLADNTFVDGKVKVRILGDINGDGTVDGSDLIIVARAFGSYGPNYLGPGSPAHPRWNPDSDITEDNVVDGLDLLAVARNFGKSCPP